MADKKVTEASIDIAVALIPTDMIDDNPYNPRLVYVDDEIESMGDSLLKFGLREVPTARRKDGRVQMAFGHKRLRGFRRNQNKAPVKTRDDWNLFPVLIKDLSDTEMFDYALLENLERSDVKPIDLARAIAKFTELNPTVKDKDIAKKHGMTEANISNMRRVLRLPQGILNKIDEGVISITQGRELLTLEKKPCADQLMNESLAYVLDCSCPNTVEGMQKAIKKTLEKYYPPKEKQFPLTATESRTNISQENKAGDAAAIVTTPSGTGEAKPPIVVEVAAVNTEIKPEVAVTAEKPAVAPEAVAPAVVAEPPAKQEAKVAPALPRELRIYENPNAKLEVKLCIGEVYCSKIFNGSIEEVIPILPDFLTEAMAKLTGEKGKI